MAEQLVHICEVCGKKENLTPDEAFDAGWDYPPRIGVFGVVSPRTCGNCGIDKTLYWRLLTNPEYRNNITEEDIALIERITNEPESIKPRPTPATGADQGEQHFHVPGCHCETHDAPFLNVRDERCVEWSAIQNGAIAARLADERARIVALLDEYEAGTLTAVGTLIAIEHIAREGGQR